MKPLRRRSVFLKYKSISKEIVTIAYMSVSKLSNQYSALLGHQNHKQKVKHVVQLKEENVSLKSKVEALQLDLSK